MLLATRSVRRVAHLASSLLPAVMLLAAGAPLGFTAAASAQPVIRTMGMGDRPISAGRIGKSALERYGKVLGLDEAQTAAAAALHEVYAENNRAAGKAMSDKMKELEPKLQDGDMDVIEKQIPAVMEENGKKTAEYEQSFLDDLKALLTPEQAQTAWPKLERLRRREDLLRGGAVSGSNVDLVELVDRLNLNEDQRTAIRETLDLYEVDVDRLLQDIQRDAEAARRGRPAGGPVIVNLDRAELRERMKKRVDSFKQVKDLNQRYIRLLATALPDAQRAALEEQFKVASFRTIYRDSASGRRLAAAGKLDDLTDAQKKRLSELSENYRRQARTANDRWAAAQEQAEAEGKYTGGRMGLAFNVGGEAPPQALADARTARRQLDSQIDGELDSILNDSQKGRLPKSNPGRQLFGGESVDVIADGEGGHAVFVTAIAAGEGDEPMEGEEGEEGGVIVTRQVIVTAGDPHATEPADPPQPAEPGEPKKEEPKKDEPK